VSIIFQDFGRFPIYQRNNDDNDRFFVDSTIDVRRLCLPTLTSLYPDSNETIL